MFSLRRGTGRLFAALLFGLSAGLLTFCTDSDVQWWVRAVVGWDFGSLALVALAWGNILREGAADTRRHAGEDDPGRNTVFVVALTSSLFSLFAAAVVLREVKKMPVAQELTWTLLTLAAIALAWVVTHTSYTFRYAHLYYRRRKASPHDDAAAKYCLQFPGTGEPSAVDFAYFAFTIGMCFQVSDVVVQSTRMRRAVLLHSVLSFVYNTTILALALNLAFGLMT
jgi:uncharacterized membrane protein